MGGNRFDCIEDRLHRRDAAKVGATSGARSGARPGLTSDERDLCDPVHLHGAKSPQNDRDRELVSGANRVLREFHRRDAVFRVA